MKPAVSPDVLQILTRTSRFLIDEGVPAYLVGGLVRDMLLGRDTADIDIAVTADALATASGAADTLGARYVRLEERLGRVVFPDTGRHIDFTTLEGGIDQDLARRDFTIDAMAFELDKALETNFDETALIDPFFGLKDLRDRKVRVVRDTVFREDAVRLLRAMRISGELGFDVAAATEDLVRRDAALIAGVAGERAREELLRLLALPGAGRRLAYLDELGLLTALFPELVPTRGVDQPVVHIWDVYQHSIQAVAALEYVLREAGWEHAGPEALAMAPWSERLGLHFEREVSRGSTRRSLLKLATLLHDVAKPQTKATDTEGRTRFIGHPQEGAAIAAVVLERLRFSNREIQFVELLVRYHLRPTQMGQEDAVPTRRAIYRYFRDLGDIGIDLLFLSLADHLATRGRTLDMEQWRQHTALTAYVLENRFAATPAATPRLIDGDDIITIFGLGPGPRIGELLENVREARAAGEITERQQALDLVRDLLNNPAPISRSRPSQEKND